MAFDDISGVIGELGLKSLVLVGLSMGGRNAIYFTSKRPELVQKLVIVDIGPEISKRAARRQPDRRSPRRGTASSRRRSISTAATRIRGIHYYRWVASTSLRQRADGALVWAWHPSVKERRSQLDIDWWAVLKSITAPTLVLRGESSTVLDRDVAERMGKELPHGRFVEIPGPFTRSTRTTPRPSSPRSRSSSRF